VPPAQAAGWRGAGRDIHAWARGSLCV